MDSISSSFDLSEFVRQVRMAHLQSGHSLKGAPGLSVSVKQAIHLVAAELCQPPIDTTANQRETLLMRFEEMARRNGHSVDQNKRPALITHLLGELRINAGAALTIPVDKLILVTAYAGACLPGLPMEFAGFADSPSIFKYAAVHNPADPRGFLRKVQHNIAAMAKEPEFAGFADSPFIFKHAAVHNPADPRGFLRKVQHNIAAMAKEPEFADFADSPSIFKYAAVHNPADPRGFLRKVQHNIAAMAKEPEFAGFADSPSIFKHAAVHNPADPRGFLRKVQHNIAAMAKEPEFAGFADSPSIFKHAAVHNPADPRGFLRKVKCGEATYG